MRAEPLRRQPFKTNVRVVARWIAVATCFGAAWSAYAGDGEASGVDIVSSVMWQPLDSGDSYVYPPGIPAVLRKEEGSRHFRVEQYFSAAVSASALVPHVRGPWPQGHGFKLKFEKALSLWRNQYIEVSQPVCDAKPSESGYRCTTDLRVSPYAPSGTVGISLGVMVGGVEFTHPNSVFWIILPEEDVESAPPRMLQAHADAVRDGATYDKLEEADAGSAGPVMDLASVRKHIVRISLGGNFSLGSGYVTRSVEPLRKLFRPEAFQDAGGAPGPKVYVVTAAHLFPIAYSYGALGELAPYSGGQPFSTGYIYDLHVGGERLPRAALLLARNVESDVALMQIRPQVLPRLAHILGVEAPEAIQGLEIARSIDSDPERPSAKVILGYPAAREGELVERLGRLSHNEYPTDDTSNFGPLLKFKLEALNPFEADLAEPGMSGGPVVDQDGRVIGLTVERPNDTNTLIGLDFTSLGHLEGGFALDEGSCMLQFNPFDRILRLVKHDAKCDYGRFGSPRMFGLLEGEWTIQEVLGFASEAVAVSDHSRLRFSGGRHQFTNGHSIINGHAVINGHTIINGHSIIRSGLLIVNRENLQRINDFELRSGFQLNPDSFRNFVPKGVRILNHSNSMRVPLVAPLGSLILGTRDSHAEHGFTPVYSIREFAIWLHQNAGQDNYADLVCVHGNGCERG